MTSKITALLLSLVVLSQAEDSIGDAFKNGKWNGRIRFQDFITNWNNPVKQNADGTALGGASYIKVVHLMDCRLEWDSTLRKMPLGLPKHPTE